MDKVVQVALAHVCSVSEQDDGCAPHAAPDVHAVVQHHGYELVGQYVPPGHNRYLAHRYYWIGETDAARIDILSLCQDETPLHARGNVMIAWRETLAGELAGQYRQGETIESLRASIESD